MGVRLVINGKVHSSDNKSKNDDLNVLDHGLLENRDAMNQHPIFAIEGLQEALNNLSSNIVNIENKTVTIQQTLEAGNKTITFYNIPSSETLIEFFASKPINYRKLDDSISGRITLTYPEQDDDVIIYCKIEFLTI
jgi:hypothetical protein